MASSAEQKRIEDLAKTAKGSRAFLHATALNRKQKHAPIVPPAQPPTELAMVYLPALIQLRKEPADPKNYASQVSNGLAFPMGEAEGQTVREGTILMMDTEGKLGNRGAVKGRRSGPDLRNLGNIAAVECVGSFNGFGASSVGRLRFAGIAGGTFDAPKAKTFGGGPDMIDLKVGGYTWTSNASAGNIGPYEYLKVVLPTTKLSTDGQNIVAPAQPEIGDGAHPVYRAGVAKTSPFHFFQNLDSMLAGRFGGGLPDGGLIGDDDFKKFHDVPVAEDAFPSVKKDDVTPQMSRMVDALHGHKSTRGKTSTVLATHGDGPTAMLKLMAFANATADGFAHVTAWLSHKPRVVSEIAAIHMDDLKKEAAKCAADAKSFEATHAGKPADQLRNVGHSMFFTNVARIFTSIMSNSAANADMISMNHSKSGGTMAVML